MITNAVDTILNPPDYIETGMDSENDRSYNPLRDFAGNLADTAFRGVIVCRDKIPEDKNIMMLPWTNEEIGHAGIANTSTDPSIGTYNENESGRIENGKGYRHVWDFASDRANGEISCICLTTKDGGTNGYHNTYYNLSSGGTDLNSNSTDHFNPTYHTIVARYINDAEFNASLYKWFYMGRLEDGNVRLLGKHTQDGGIYEVKISNPMSISVSNDKPYCGIISVKKVIELFPAAEKVPGSMYNTLFFHGSYFYDCADTKPDYIPSEEKERMQKNWENSPQWLAFFPYVIGGKIHIVGTSVNHIHHYVFDLNSYTQLSKTVVEVDVTLQNYNTDFNFVQISSSPYTVRWFYGTRVNDDCNNALSAFEWDNKYFVITKNPLINGEEVTSSDNYGQLRVFTKDGKSTGKAIQCLSDHRLPEMTESSFWGFYVDEKTNTPLVIYDSCNLDYSAFAEEIVKRDYDYDRYSIRLSMPVLVGHKSAGSYATLIKTEGVSLPLYIAPYYPSALNNRHYFGFALGICKLCLTTINNLAEPVRKLDGQVMKITYDIVDE